MTTSSSSTAFDLTSSDLTRINFTGSDPFDLFNEWYQEAYDCRGNYARLLCLATVGRNGRVGNRTLFLRKIKTNSICIMTDRRGRKAQDLEHNPNAAITMVWFYTKDGIAKERQVRFEGHVKELTYEEGKALYESEPLYCKIRNHICHQGTPVEWEDLKTKHDDILKQVVDNDLHLPVPEHFVAYELIPDYMEFYYAVKDTIGDRLKFIIEPNTRTWSHIRISA